MWAYIKSISFYIAFVADCLAVLVAVYFILEDYLRYGEHFHLGKLLKITLLFCVWLAVVWFLRSIGWSVLASSMAWIPAVPIFGYAFFVLMIIILRPDFK